LDGERLSWKRFQDGKAVAQRQAPHGVRIQNETYRLALEAGSAPFAGKIFDGAAWKALPTLNANTSRPADSRFGFYLPNNEEMWLADFVFKPIE
jgi:hypothetical protein